MYQKIAPISIIVASTLFGVWQHNVAAGFWFLAAMWMILCSLAAALEDK